MADQFVIYITGDAAEDVYSWAEEGGRSARPAMRNLPADQADDVVIPSGANFVKHVFDNILDPECNIIKSVSSIPERTKPLSLPVDCLDQILIHLKTFGKAYVAASGEIIIL
jgi:hypothetical protein